MQEREREREREREKERKCKSLRISTTSWHQMFPMAFKFLYIQNTEYLEHMLSFIHLFTDIEK